MELHRCTVIDAKEQAEKQKETPVPTAKLLAPPFLCPAPSLVQHIIFQTICAWKPEFGLSLPTSVLPFLCHSSNYLSTATIGSSEVSLVHFQEGKGGYSHLQAASPKKPLQKSPIYWNFAFDCPC